MAMENGPVEDVFPIENGDFPLPAMLVYWRVTTPFLLPLQAGHQKPSKQSTQELLYSQAPQLF